MEQTIIFERPVAINTSKGVKKTKKPDDEPRHLALSAFDIVQFGVEQMKLARKAANERE
jgi:hypothetical protein